MFVSIISHSKIRQKGIYYHGWDEKIYRKSDTCEIAYTPEIDGIPNFLQAQTELKATQALAFILAYSPRYNSTIILTRKVSLTKLYKTFRYTNIIALKQLIKTTTSLELQGAQNFSCEVYLLGNARKQISRCPPQRATRPFERVYIDIVGPVTPVGVDKERWWIIYTDDYTRYRWIDVTTTKDICTDSLLRFMRMIKTQFNATVAICHLDNDIVLVNNKTKEQLSQLGTVFEASTPYTPHQNGVAESSNRIEEARVRLMMIGAPHLPNSLWPYAARYATELINHYPTTDLAEGKTPR